MPQLSHRVNIPSLVTLLPEARLYIVFVFHCIIQLNSVRACIAVINIFQTVYLLGKYFSLSSELEVSYQ